MRIRCLFGFHEYIDNYYTSDEIVFFRQCRFCDKGEIRIK